MHNRNKEWSKQDFQDALALHGDGESDKYIAQALGRTTEAITRMLGIIAPKKTLEARPRRKTRFESIQNKITRENAELLMKEIPTDTRTWVQMMCGDPVQGRSAANNTDTHQGQEAGISRSGLSYYHHGDIRIPTSGKASWRISKINLAHVNIPEVA